MPKEVMVAGVTVDPVTKSPIVVLRDPETGNVIPIWIVDSERVGLDATLSAVRASVSPPSAMRSSLAAAFI